MITTSDLTPLAKSGVLFLNTCLTVRAHKSHSHARKGWEELTTAALRAVVHRKAANDDDDNWGVVILAWGLPAQKTCLAVGIDEVSTGNSIIADQLVSELTMSTLKKKHLVLKWVVFVSSHECSWQIVDPLVIDQLIHHLYLRTEVSSETRISNKQMRGWSRGMGPVRASTGLH